MPRVSYKMNDDASRRSTVRVWWRRGRVMQCMNAACLLLLSAHKRVLHSLWLRLECSCELLRLPHRLYPVVVVTSVGGNSEREKATLRDCHLKRTQEAAEEAKEQLKCACQEEGRKLKATWRRWCWRRSWCILKVASTLSLLPPTPVDAKHVHRWRGRQSTTAVQVPLAVSFGILSYTRFHQNHPLPCRLLLAPSLRLLLYGARSWQASSSAFSPRRWPRNC